MIIYERSGKVKPVLPVYLTTTNLTNIITFGLDGQLLSISATNEHSGNTHIDVYLSRGGTDYLIYCGQASANETVQFKDCYFTCLAGDIIKAQADGANRVTVSVSIAEFSS